jgi:hypothetical protein
VPEGSLFTLLFEPFGLPFPAFLCRLILSDLITGQN